MNKNLPRRRELAWYITIVLRETVKNNNNDDDDNKNHLRVAATVIKALVGLKVNISKETTEEQSSLSTILSRWSTAQRNLEFRKTMNGTILYLKGKSLITDRNDLVLLNRISA